MYRGTTPTICFSIPFDTALIQTAWITFEQAGIEVFTKEMEDCTVSENSLTVRLTQEETLNLVCGCKTVDMQIRVKLSDGTALASNVMVTDVDKILKDGVI